MQNAVEQSCSDNIEVYIGRQPILDQNLKTCAYELLFRPGKDNEAGFIDGERATAQVIHNSLMEIGLDNLVGSNLAYINFTREFLTGDIAELLPRERVVLEVLEDVEIDEELIRGIRSLVDSGFVLALDDFEYHPKWEPLISLAAIIKFDVLTIGIDRLEAQVNQVKHHGLKLLAEKVETREEFDKCKAMGFDYFQGYFFARPRVISQKKLPDNQLALLNLLAKLQQPEIEIEEIEQLVSLNFSLTYKLLRYINSASFSLPNRINSIRQVVIYFGLQRLKNWASLVALTDVSNKPSELLETGLIRAKMCELLALELKRSESESYFMLGLFSILDALMDSTMAEVLERLPITEEVAVALGAHEGELGEILAYCLAMEQGKHSDMTLEGIEEGVVNNIYVESILWARQTLQGLV